jgi:DNA repair protein RecN (Recombination protein N)
MLSHLHIENFALIDRLDIDFGEGLNVLTGATGAGKSIIIGALDLILGGRGSEEVVRTGELSATVEATFTLSDKSLANRLREILEIPLENDSLIIRREYRRKGGGRAFIDSSQVAITVLKDIAEQLADILGQHSHQALLDPGTHCSYLDRFAKLEDKVLELRVFYNRAVELRDKLASADRIAREIADRIDLLAFQISEIEKARLHPDEEEKLKGERKLLENAQKIRETAELCSRILLEDDNSAVEKIGEAEKSLGSIAGLSDAVRKIIDALRGTIDGLRESIIDLQRFAEQIDADPQRLEQVNERLDEIFRLKKKYGSDIFAILEYAEKGNVELAKLKSQETDTKNLKRNFEATVHELNLLAEEISNARRKAAPALEKIIVEKLALMGISKAQFVINIAFHEGADGLYERSGRRLAGDGMGFDNVEFQFCANPGEGLKPLAKIASGGEISRVMLALKNAFLHKKGGTCEVFDEIDVGISGDVAAKVGRQLRELSKKHQVICITHLHQIASVADHHFRVFKNTLKGRSVTRVQKLNHDERVKEIAALLSGEKISDKAIAGAKELLKNSSEEN